jgi:hypothetical protein
MQQVGAGTSGCQSVRGGGAVQQCCERTAWYVVLQLHQCCCAEYQEYLTVCTCTRDGINSLVVLLCVRSMQGCVFGQQGPLQGAWRAPHIHLC